MTKNEAYQQYNHYKQKFEQQQADLLTLADAVIKSHPQDCKYCNKDITECGDLGCIDAICQCPACQLARKVKGE